MSFATSRILVTICIFIFLMGDFSCYCLYRHRLSLAEAEEISSDTNITANNIADNNNFFENFAKQFGNLVTRFEYTVDVGGKQIFPNDTIKQDIVSRYKSSIYYISSLKYKLLGFDITASDIKIEVAPSRIDATTTKLDLPVVLARDVTVTNGLINLKYSEVNLSSIYGIYDKLSDKLTLHIPISVALRYFRGSI